MKRRAGRGHLTRGLVVEPRPAGLVAGGGDEIVQITFRFGDGRDVSVIPSGYVLSRFDRRFREQLLAAKRVEDPRLVR